MKQVLYLGSDPHHYAKKGDNVVHCPLINIVPKEWSLPEIAIAFADFSEYTHLIFTSKHAVDIFFMLTEKHAVDLGLLSSKERIAVGSVTAAALEKQGFKATRIAREETQEGLIEILSPLDLEEAYLFLPRSSLSRPLLSRFLQERDIRHQTCDIYDTLPQRPDPLPDLHHFDEIIFTSPSTVNAFFQLFAKIPFGKRIGVKGPITQSALLSHLTEEHEVFYV